MTSELNTTNSRFRGPASILNEINRLGRHFIGLLAVGVLIGLACLPLNLVDRIQEWFFDFLPTTGQTRWTSIGLLIAIAPVVVRGRPPPEIRRLRAIQPRTDVETPGK